MDHAENAPEHVAKAVFWAILVASLTFIAGVIILVR
jgi:hypothetical protein